METTHIEQTGMSEQARADLRAMILQTEERIRELHKAGGGNPSGLGMVETYGLFPPALKDFVGSADDVLPLSPEEGRQLEQLIQRAADGLLGEPGHDAELDQFLDYSVMAVVGRVSG